MDSYSVYNDLYTTPGADILGPAEYIIAGFIGLIVVLCVVMLVIEIIGMWKVFTKAGEPGWKAIIPFYNIAMLYKISGMSPYLVFVYICLFIPVVNIFAGVAIVIINLYQKVNLMKAFKASAGLTVAMLVIPFITYMILGFGKSKYYGLAVEAEKVEDEQINENQPKDDQPKDDNQS